MKQLICLLILFCHCLAALAAAPAEPACSHCEARLHTVQALRAALPVDWRVDTAREPVFGSDILTVQAGLEHERALLLVHGLGSNGFTDWMPILPRLAERYHVIALDLPGFGYSANPRGKYSPRNYARILDWLLARHAKGKALVIGHSLGGAVALRFAIDYPERVEKLVLVDAAGILHRNAFVKNTARVPLEVAQTPDPLKDAVVRLKVFGNATVERAMNLADPTRILNSSDTVWNTLLAGSPQANAAMALVEEDFSGEVGKLGVPTWLVWGSADPVAPMRTGQALASRLPRAGLLVMKDVGHVPMAAPHSADFLNLLEPALESVPPTPREEDAPAATADLKCKKDIGRRFSGRYREVVLEGCRAILLEDLRAERIVLIDSIVEMRNVRIASEDMGVALDVTHSELFGTVGSVSGETAMRVDRSRLDLAGFVIEGRAAAIEVLRASRLIASLSELKRGYESRPWQETVEIQKGTLGP